MREKTTHSIPESPLAKAAASEKKMIEKGPATVSPPSAAGRYFSSCCVLRDATAAPRAGFSTEYSANNAWNLSSSGELDNYNNNYNNKNNSRSVRGVRASSASSSSGLPSLFMQDADGKVQLEDLFEAYFECRRTKRNSKSALQFELDYEHNLVELCDDINEGRYRISPSIAFVVRRPKLREVFAADFRDRIVHHYVIRRLNPLFERLFINDSYSCRTGKGTLYGIRRIARFMDECSHGYTKDAYVLKLDIRGFFMHIDKALLERKLCQFIEEQYFGRDKHIVMRLCSQIVANDPTQGCIIHGTRNDWEGLPCDKSLFHVGAGLGLPIGNLTSQLFANFYMDGFDKYVTEGLGFKHYGRYVDDFVLISDDRDRLKSSVPLLRRFLSERLHLELHPDKVYLQPCRHGVKFTGAVVKRGCLYVGNRTVGYCWVGITRHNAVAVSHRPTTDEVAAFRSTVNSYFGLMRHYRSWNIQRRMKRHFSPYWWNVVQMRKGYVSEKRRKLNQREIKLMRYE